MKIKSHITILLFGLGVSAVSEAQKPEAEVYKGNELYKKQQFDKATEEYQKALSKDPKNEIANFNSGNARFRQNKYDEALQSFDKTITTSTNKNLQQQAYYNKGVSFSKEQRLEESIEAWKQALKMNPDDKQTRENLEKALRELKKKQEEQKQKEKKEKKQDQKQQQNKQQSKLSQQRVEQLLKALQQKEKEVNDKLNQNKVAAPSKPDKDW